MSEIPREYLIKKGSYFYRPNCSGYTSFKFDAGRYTKDEAEREASVEPWHMYAVHQDDVPNDTAPDKAISDLSSELDRLREENAKLEDWSKAWHRTVETMCVLIGINGSASPEEILDELQSRTAALSPDNSTQKKEG